MEVFELEQGTPEWFAIRAGMPTASCFAQVMQKPGPRGGVPKGRQTYMFKLAGELLTGEPMSTWSNADMERGKEREAEGRATYELIQDVTVEQIGFVKNGLCGCSPDGLIGKDGLFENKDAAAHIQIERLLNGGLPSEHVAQVQGQLMVTERDWCDFQSYCRGIRPLIVRVYRDDDFIKELRAAVDQFVSELNELVGVIRG